LEIISMPSYKGSGNKGRPSSPKLISELRRFPKAGPGAVAPAGQKQTPVPVKDLGIAADDWESTSVIQRGSRSTKEIKAANEAAVRTVARAYFNRAKNGQHGPQMEDEDYE
jgi:hypothetical protein